MTCSVIRQTAIIAALAAIMASSSTMAATMFVGTSTGNGADTSLQNDGQNGGTSATVFGAGPTADFRRYDDVRQKMLLLRFDISDLDASAYADAVLRFDYFSNRNRTMRVYGIGEDFDNWDEATTSYSNAPGILQPDQGGAAYDSAGNNFLDPSELFFTPPIPGLNPFQLGTINVVDTRGLPGGRGIAISNPANLNLSGILNADTDGLVSFLLFHDGTDSSQTGNISTKEAANPNLQPYLGVLPTYLIPEPSSAVLVLLGVGAAGMFARRR